MDCQQQQSRSAQESYYRRIIDFLDQNEIEYKTVQHEETFTSEESARVRGVPLSAGGKALLLKTGDDDDENGKRKNKNNFSLFVMSASRKLDSKAIKKEMKKTKGKASKNIRFATREELETITNGLVPGCVPPFGKPIVKSSAGDDDDNNLDQTVDENGTYLELYVDTSIGEENDIIAFNAGSLTNSVIMSVQDYLRVSAPTGIFTFSKV